MQRGKFIVFEGIDGSGKSTQHMLAANHIFGLSKYNHIFLTREPFLAHQIRRKLQKAKNTAQNPRWYLNAFVADRKKHSKVIKQQLKKGMHCVCDRYDLSTYFYQHAQGMPMKTIKKLHKGILIPDLYLVYDCYARIAFKRRSKEGATSPFDKDLTFLDKVGHLYHKSKKLLPSKNIVLIDANKPIENVFKETKKHIDKLFKKE